jgi:DNA-binding MarR family transcriptional regulator
MKKKLSAEDYNSLAEFRQSIRRYLRFSEKAVRSSELEPFQYQLLLALKGMPPKVRPRIAELAERLQVQHHSVVSLVDRLEARGLVRRKRGTSDRREVLVILTPLGEKTIEELVTLHLAEVSSHGSVFLQAARRVVERSRRIQTVPR